MPLPSQSVFEDKILKASKEAFLNLGYHGTTLEKIACMSGVDKSLVYSSFRSKDNLYSIVLNDCLCELYVILGQLRQEKENISKRLNKHFNVKRKRAGQIAWFLFNEMRVNSLIIRNLSKSANNISRMMIAVWSDMENLDLMKDLIKEHFDEIVEFFNEIPYGK